MRRFTAALTASAVLVVGYAGLDAADRVPGLLTTRALPPPPPTETPGTRTLPVVPQPSPSTSVRMPLGSLAGDSAAPSAAGVRRALGDVRDLPALSDAALVVRDGQSGEVLFDQGGTERRIPASTTKLLAGAAIGQVFAPDETLTTQVRQGRSPDEIVLVAGGDTLIAPGAGDRDAVAGRAGLADLANQVVKALEDSGIDAVKLSLDASYAPSDSDILLVPRGYHPFGAPAGYDAYYLNVMAGPKRAWHFTVDPDHAWLTRVLVAVPLPLLGLYAEQPYTRKDAAAPSAPSWLEADLRPAAFEPLRAGLRDRVSKWEAIRQYASQLPLLALQGSVRRGPASLALATELVAWAPGRDRGAV